MIENFDVGSYIQDYETIHDSDNELLVINTNAQDSQKYVDLINDLYDDDFIEVKTNSNFNNVQDHVIELSNTLGTNLAIVNNENQNDTNLNSDNVNEVAKKRKQSQNLKSQKPQFDLRTPFIISMMSGNDATDLDDIIKNYKYYLKDLVANSSVGKIFENLKSDMIQKPFLEYIIRSRILTDDNLTKQLFLVNTTDIFSNDYYDLKPYNPRDGLFKFIHIKTNPLLISLNHYQSMPVPTEEDLPEFLEFGELVTIDSNGTLVNINYSPSQEYTPEVPDNHEYDLSESISINSDASVIIADIFASTAAPDTPDDSNHVVIVI